MDKGLQKVCVWSGMVAVNLFFVGLLLMKFFPPLSPSLTAEAVAEIYRANALEILLGASVIIVSTMFNVPYIAALFVQLKRMEKGRQLASYGLLAAGAANTLFFILPGLFWAIAAYRPERPIEITSALNDIAWMFGLLPWTLGPIQCLFIGSVVMKYGEGSKVYPKWVGFFNIWVAIGMITSAGIPFFKKGPFAWDGVIGFWFPAIILGIWYMVMCWMTHKAIGRDDGQ